MLSYDADPVRRSTFQLLLTQIFHFLDGSIVVLWRATVKKNTVKFNFSYFDLIFSGNWASGLEVKGKAKTGADETANGELYQMRPYPSPGDILRMNAEQTKKKPKH